LDAPMNFSCCYFDCNLLSIIIINDERENPEYIIDLD